MGQVGTELLWGAGLDLLLRKHSMKVQGVVKVIETVQMSPECFSLPAMYLAAIPHSLKTCPELFEQLLLQHWRPGQEVAPLVQASWGHYGSVGHCPTPKTLVEIKDSMSIRRIMMQLSVQLGFHATYIKNR